MLVFKYGINLTQPETNTIVNMICPNDTSDWRFQIVANTRNQIDVDKIDYIIRDCYHIGLTCGSDFTRIVTQCRVIGDTICFPEKIRYNIFTLFTTRYRLHKQIYNHPTVIAYEFIVVEILKEIMKGNHEFGDLTDSIVTCRFHHSLHQQKLFKRKHKVMIGEKLFNSPIDREKYAIDPLLQTQIYKIGFVSGDKANPLDHVWFYSRRNPDEKFQLRKEEISFIVPSTFQESGIRWYCEREHAPMLEEKLKEFIESLDD